MKSKPRFKMGDKVLIPAVITFVESTTRTVGVYFVAVQLFFVIRLLAEIKERLEPKP